MRDKSKHPPMQPGWIERPHQRAELGDLELENGAKIERYVQSYVTHGMLNAARDNAVLVCISLTGNHHRLDFLIGSGRALDTNRHFVVCADPIGNGLSTSPSNSERQPGMRFPRFSIRDMLAAQQRLLAEVLHIDRLVAVIGASMGGMQALQCAVSHPSLPRRVIAMTPMAKTTSWAALVVHTARLCLMADPAWSPTGFASRPERGWRAYTGLMTALLSRTPAAVDQFATDPGAAMQWFDALDVQNAGAGFDAHDYLYQSWAYEAHDVGATRDCGGNTERALQAITARTLIAAPPLDLFNPAEAARWAAQRIRDARFVEIPSLQGHQAATATRAEDAAFLNRVIGDFLNE
jgi:homoserine O-acetyltransferase/O-succinyltransferase